MPLTASTVLLKALTMAILEVMLMTLELVVMAPSTVKPILEETPELAVSVRPPTISLASARANRLRIATTAEKTGKPSVSYCYRASLMARTDT